ncbi:SH3-domain-containing protein [Pleurotus eryngii]|uniref:SH3-domain-containing protein n=1 Tax=Pleurotus eryngii TaxID=5323 RepID=A0A9P5ZTV1_PLEER|nr:SH3-domain-containing protein [Pleurotus eryngii]
MVASIDSNALLDHIISQTRQNVEFLMNQNHITAADGRDILAKITVPSSPSPVSSLAQQTQRLGINNPIPQPQPQAHPPPPVPLTKSSFQARALWAYNENRQEPNDLTFRAGDVIEVTEETNADWWKGRINGQEGIFPSNYVERVAAPPSSFSPSPLNEKAYQPSYYSAPGPVHAQPSYAPQPGYAPPPPNPGYHHAAPTVPAPAPAEEPKKAGFFSKPLGNTLAHSAVGGVGFGAGSAVGSGIIHAIF